MKSVLLSIKPKYCELIAGGIKTIEVRKTKPKLDTPFKCYIYETKTKDFYSVLHKKIIGKVIGEFICSEITEFESEFWDDETYERIQTIIKDCERYFEFGEYEYETVATNEDENYKENWLCKQSCVSWEEMRKYVGTGIKEFYGWHISDLKIYDTPKELSGFIPNCTGLQNGECVDFKNTSCPCQERDYNPDGTVNVCKCINRMKRPPQSWCYVEEVTE